MSRFTLDDVADALKGVGVQPGSVVFMHSALWPLGRMAGVSAADMPKAIIDRMVAFLGPSGTLAVPAFSYAVAESGVFDRLTTSAGEMGVLAETLRSRPDAQRSPHPLQSIAAVGQAATEISARDTSGGLSPGSAFGYLVEVDARLLFFGADISSASLVHYVEETHAVPYRYWKPFAVRCRVGGIESDRSYEMFVRDLDIDPTLDLSFIERALDATSALARAPLGNGVVMSCTFGAFIDAVSAILSDDPFGLVADQKVADQKVADQNGESTNEDDEATL